MTESLRPDLEGTTCCIGTCFNVADVMGVATVTVPVIVGLPPGQDGFALELPFCVEHAHLLRMGITTCELDSRIS